MTKKRAERTKHDFWCSICRSAIGQDSCLICARRRQLTLPFCCQISLIEKGPQPDQILPVTWPFVISKLHCRRIMAQYIPSVLIPPGICRAFLILEICQKTSAPGWGICQFFQKRLTSLLFNISLKNMTLSALEISVNTQLKRAFFAKTRKVAAVGRSEERLGILVSSRECLTVFDSLRHMYECVYSR